MIITEKVSFNIASEVSYVYILSGQKGVVSLIIFRDILEVLANLSVDYHQNWAIGPTFHGGQFGPVTGPLA